MTVLRARAVNAQGQPVQGRTATLEPYEANRYVSPYSGGPGQPRGLPATSGADGWLSWTLPGLLRRPGPKGTYWLITGLEAQPVVAATQPGDGTVTLDQRRIGTLDAKGNLVVPPAVDTAAAAAAAAAAAQASTAALTTGAPTALDTFAEIATELQGRLSDAALRAALVPRLFAAIPRAADAFPSIAATLPTFSGTNSYTPTNVVERAVLADNTGVARWTGPVAVGTTSGRVGSAEPHGITGSPVCWEWISDAPEIAMKGQFHVASPYWLLVDGEVATPTPQVPAGNTYEIIKWSGVRKMRHYKLYANNGFTLSALAMTAADSVYRPPQRRPLVGWMGDSYSQGGPGPGSAPADLPYLVSRMLGWDLRKSADGGSGYQTITPAGGVQNTFLDRIPDLDNVPLDAMIFAGGINDAATGLQAAATGVLGRFRQTHPTAPLFVIGPWSPSSTYETTNAAKWTAVQAACIAAGGVFIDNRGWITGTGKSGALAGNGNADSLIGPDGTHPTNPGGTSFLASRVVHAITANLGGLAA